MKKKLSIRCLMARFFGWLLVLSFLNTVIDTRDIDVSSFKASYNEMESIAEWVMEDVMDMDDAIPEQDEADTDKKPHQPAGDWEDYFPVYDPPPLIGYHKEVSKDPSSDHLSPLLRVATPPPDRRL